mmetsp:Transcript_482/g.887  ORF Transcript_482/g.887 Transcript_482/m.887 type:complete len:395 (-) Transcript_482:420-1604(-)
MTMSSRVMLSPPRLTRSPCGKFKMMLSPFCSLSRESEDSFASDVTMSMSPFKVFSSPSASLVASPTMFEISNEEASNLVTALDPILSPAPNAAESFAALQALAFGGDCDTESVQSEEDLFSLYNELTSPGLREAAPLDEEDPLTFTEDERQCPFDLGSRERSNVVRRINNKIKRAKTIADFETAARTPERRSRTHPLSMSRSFGKQLFGAGEDDTEDSSAKQTTKNKRIHMPKRLPRRRTTAKPSYDRTGAGSAANSSPASTSSQATTVASPQLLEAPIAKRRKMNVSPSESLLPPHPRVASKGSLNLGGRRSGQLASVNKRPLIFTSATGETKEIALKPLFALRKTAPATSASRPKLTFSTKRQVAQKAASGGQQPAVAPWVRKTRLAPLKLT